MYNPLFKRVLDLFCCLVGLILLSPVLIVVFLIILLSTGKSPFFFQLRPGKGEKIFKVIKFKTMTDRKDTEGNFLPDEKRLTSIGKFIRKTSLDELPQLINVLKGDMSIIGPRPLLPEYIPLFNATQKKRHNVKPGITGWAQVNGRNAISWNKKFELDVWYVNNISFILDVKILLKTVLKVIKSEGINAVNAVTTEKYTGKN